jgi:stearoyl-CoA desaturase (Delta-9 desaturase)
MDESSRTHSPRLVLLSKLAPLGAVFVGAPLAIAVAVIYGIATHAIVSLLIVGIFTGLGVTIGFHRLFTHRSFATSRSIERIFMLLGCMAGQSSPFFWIAIHRKHHRHSDAAGDPHSPYTAGSKRLGLIRGFWHSHLGWTWGPAGYDSTLIRDLRRRVDFVWIDRFWYVWYLFGLALPAAAGGLIGGTAYDMLIGFLWGGLLRHAITQQATYAVNSLTHIWGSKPFATGDESRNNMLVGILALGEGWHNNHHAFPYSARHGLRWWQLDATWCVIWFMERTGLAWKVRLPKRYPAANPASQPAAA